MTPKFECKYCHKSYVQEDAYMRHMCTQMKRMEEIKTTEGIMAYQFYCKWMQYNRRNAPSIDIFTTSRYYTGFINFASYITRVKLADVDQFIKLMVERDLSPTLWTNDKVYVLYIEYLDRQSSPIKQAMITVNTLFSLSDAYGCDVSNVFDHLSVHEALQLLRQRKLTPWILLISPKFKQYLQKCLPEERKMFEELIRPMFWHTRFSKYPDTVKHMKQCVTEMGL